MSPLTVGYIIAVDALEEDRAAYPAVQNFVDLYENEVEDMVLFGPWEATIPRDSVEVVTVPRDPPTSASLRALDYAWYQLRLAFELFRARNRCDSMFFHVGGTVLLLPLLACRLAGLPTNVFVLGSSTRSYYEVHGRNAVSAVMVGLLAALEWATCRIADRILVLSENMVSPGDGRLPSASPVVANLNYIDCGRFVNRQPSEERTYDIIYVGRFERVKGIIKLARALTRFVECHPDARICLVGDGSFSDDVERILREGNAIEQIDLVGWVDHDEIPSYFADSRLLVLPSESEGVPKSILEAMACGTVPVATPVGGIPDVISDGETGFLLSDNDPETTAHTLEQALERDDLNEIADRARAYIRRTHSYDATAKQFHELLAADVGEHAVTRPVED